MTKDNGPTEKQVRQIVGAIEDKDQEIEAEHMLYMAKVKAIREDRKDIIDDAGNKGFNKKALKAKVKQRSLLRRAEAVVTPLDESAQAAFDHLTAQLGDYGSTELGKATLRAGREALDELVGRA